VKPINEKLKTFSLLFSPLWSILGWFSRENSVARNPLRVLVFDFHLIGDIVMLTPMLKALRDAYPDSHLTLVAGPWAQEILFGTELVDEIIPFAAPWVKYGQGWKGLGSCYRLVKKLRQKEWDLGIEVRGDVRQIFLLWLSKAKRRVGFDITGGGPLLTDVVPDNGVLVHITEHHQRICEYIGIWKEDDIYMPFLKLTPDELDESNKIPVFIGLHFGASLPLKRLPPDEIIKLLTSLKNTKGKLRIISAPGDLDFVPIFKQLPENIQSKLELWKGTLREFIVMSRRAKYYFCMDSGPAHIVNALGVPVSVFFGPTQAEYVRPLGKGVTVVTKQNINCRPCNMVHCINEIEQYCMADITRGQNLY
jgi:heptosyltransferase II